MRLVEIKEREIEQYDRFIRNSKNGDILQSPMWAKIKDAWQSYFLAIMEKDEILAVSTVMIRSIPYINRNFMYIPRGPVFNDYNNSQMWDFFTKEIKRFAKSKNCIFVTIVPSIEIGDEAQILVEKSGYKNVSTKGDFGGTQPKATFRVDVSPEPEEILASMPKKTRYNITYPEKKGVEYRQLGVEGLEDFMKVMDATTTRAGFLGRPLEYYKTLMENLGENISLMIAYYEDIPIAAGITIAYGDKAWAMYGGAANSHTNLKAYYGLNYKRMLWSKAKGVKYFDFFGIPVIREENKPLYGLYKFKKSFGGNEIEFIGDYDLIINRPLYLTWKIIKRIFSVLKKLSSFFHFSKKRGI